MSLALLYTQRRNLVSAKQYFYTLNLCGPNATYQQNDCSAYTSQSSLVIPLSEVQTKEHSTVNSHID